MQTRIANISSYRNYQDLDEVNRRVQTDPITFVKDCEKLYLRTIDAAARSIMVSPYPFVLLAGPSGSGKTTTARCLSESLKRYGIRTHTVELDNYPEELYVELSGDDRPYSIDVLRNQNVVVVYGRDEEGRYTVPVQVWLCSTGYTTPRGDYLLGSKREWGLLFGNVYGQYVCGITGDILFHSVPYARKEKDSLKTEEYNKLGTTASMGCVRLAAGHVKWIYDHCPSGTQVHIYDADQLPVERPEAVLLDPDDPRSGWDPTDPDPLNPWTLEPETPAPTQEESAALREEDAP